RHVPSRKARREIVGQRREALAVARIGENGRRLLRYARILWRKPQRGARFLDGALEIAGGGHHARELEAYRDVVRFPGGQRLQPFARFLRPAGAGGRVREAGQRRGIAAIERQRLLKSVVRERSEEHTSELQS